VISIRYGYRFDDETHEQAFNDYVDFEDFPKTLKDIKEEIKKVKQESNEKRKIIIFKMLLEDIN
jgi:hypothetical protein